MEQACRWREQIAGDSYDLSMLNEMNACMDTRQELWKYVEVTLQAMQEWKLQNYRKVSSNEAQFYMYSYAIGIL